MLKEENETKGFVDGLEGIQTRKFRVDLLMSMYTDVNFQILLLSMLVHALRSSYFPVTFFPPISPPGIAKTPKK